MINSRDLIFEAQQAHYYGLPAHLALASVISTPAKAAGLDHRIGFIKTGHDADIVLWDAHPLQIGATPTQVFIDGIPQLDAPYRSPSTKSQEVPKPPKWEREARDALKYEGLQPLAPRRRDGLLPGVVAFTNVGEARETVYVRNGRVVVSADGEVRAMVQEEVDLRGGQIVPGLVTVGSPLGLEEIRSEGSMTDGTVIDPLLMGVPPVLGDA